MSKDREWMAKNRLVYHKVVNYRGFSIQKKPQLFWEGENEYENPPKPEVVDRKEGK